MPTCAQIIIPMTSDLPEDVAVNNLSFLITPQNGDTVQDVILRTDPGTGTEWGVQESIQDFYETFRSQLSNSIRLTGWRIKYSDPFDAPPRYPILETTFDMPSIGGAGLPAEVALCLSFQGTKISGVPQARRRGRIYLGPLSRVVHDGVRPNEAGVDDILAAANQLLARSDAVPDWEWVVYSPTSQASTPITNGWVDNAFDTQRSRGLAPTSRSTFS